MATTGQKCTTSGIYRSDCTCHSEMTLAQGKTFPPCSDCKRAVNWTLVRAAIHK